MSSCYVSMMLSLEEAVCGRLSEAGYGSKEEMLKCLSVSEVECSSGVSEVELEKSLVESRVSEVVSLKSLKKLPWCGEKKEGLCSALKKDLGLYTQCKKECSGEYCLGCLKLIEGNGGICPHGTVSDRLKCGIMEYRDPQGKSPIAFTKIMKKLNISREEVESEGKRLGISIPECHFEETKEKTRGRPKKDTSADDTASETNESLVPISSTEKKRGRPKKEKEIISNNAGEDLIASLMQDVSATIKAPELEKELEPEEEEEETTDVEKFEFNGITYLKSEDNVLYDINSHEGIGIWNEETKEIENLPDDED